MHAEHDIVKASPSVCPSPVSCLNEWTYRHAFLTIQLPLSCARLLAGRVTTLWLSHPLSVSQHGQLSHPSLRGR